jgi:Icc protein
VARAADPRALFQAKLGLPRTHYSFDHGGWHFVVLDSIQIENDRGLKYLGGISDEQMTWLAEDLKATGPRVPVVVVTHIPLLTVFFQREKASTEPAPADRIVVNAKEVIQLLAQYNTRLVLQGHLHICERIEYGGITFITTGAVSGKWWRGPNYGHPEGFGVVTCRGDEFRYEYQTYGWVAKRPPNR